MTEPTTGHDDGAVPEGTPTPWPHFEQEGPPPGTLSYYKAEGLLASAVARINQADLIVAQAGDDFETEDRLTYGLASAFILAKVADAVTNAQAEERAAIPHEVVATDPHGDGFHIGDFTDAPRPEAYTPQPVQGVRFEAVLHGRYVGYVADRKWLHVDGVGFVDITNAEPVDGSMYRFTGRVVSATPIHMLGVTDDGVSVALPRDLVTEGPDA